MTRMEQELSIELGWITRLTHEMQRMFDALDTPALFRGFCGQGGGSTCRSRLPWRREAVPP